jgi:hypothetical protein
MLLAQVRVAVCSGTIDVRIDLFGPNAFRICVAHSYKPPETETKQ